ncbi:hypothetical protein [Mycolicibacterium sphagni]|uniref:hypothetical protein n=1 Tax=Mycolicibacterium sphagni TaxID=1786 RepID=UPI001054E1C9|nr:hypothetical protein [Mycolicibacterium sphagni]
MSAGRVRHGRTPLGAVLLLIVATAGLLGAPAAMATHALIVDMAEQCRIQYPGNAQFLPGQAYLVAPRDAFSWRCKRVSVSPDGGIIADLSVDPDAWCSRLNAGRAVISLTSPPNWQCTG